MWLRKLWDRVCQDILVLDKANWSCTSCLQFSWWSANVPALNAKVRDYLLKFLWILYYKHHGCILQQYQISACKEHVHLYPGVRELTILPTLKELTIEHNDGYQALLWNIYLCQGVLMKRNIPWSCRWRLAQSQGAPGSSHIQGCGD